jgi:hypothetical protein
MMLRHHSGNRASDYSFAEKMGFRAPVLTHSHVCTSYRELKPSFLHAAWLQDGMASLRRRLFWAVANYKGV